MKLEHEIAFELDKFTARINVHYFYAKGYVGDWSTPPEGPEIELKSIDIDAVYYPDGPVITAGWLKERGFYNMLSQHIFNLIEQELDDCLGIYDILCDYAEDR